MTARYDAHADWYVEFSRGWQPPPGLIPADVSGQRILDLACGHGPVARVLAAAGARVTGVDLSTELLARAKAEPADVTYRQGSATDRDWWDGVPFDGVVCAMALMDIDDLDAAFTTIRTVLRAGGWFSCSMFHPCFPGNDTGTPPSWPPESGYGAEGWWTTGRDGVRGHVGAHHRQLSTYLNATLRAGLVFDEFVEPDSPVPTLLIIRGRTSSATDRG